MFPEGCIASIFMKKSSLAVFYPEDGGDAFLRNLGSRKIYTAPHHR
jgi:hypothetical protein